MTLVTFRQMVGAQLLSLTRRRALIGLAALFSLGVIVIYFGASAIEHATSPANDGPAGGERAWEHSIQALSVFFGSLSAIMIGVEAGVGDTAVGVFRELVSTGRGRGWLFAVRLPAALLVTLAFTGGALALAVIGTFVFAGGRPTPSASLVVQGVLWVLLAQAVVCTVAMGIGSLTGSRAGSLTALIGWQIIATGLLVQVGSLGEARDGILNVALGQLKPGHQLPGQNHLVMAVATAVIVVALWSAAATGLGAWRTRTMDA